MQDKGSIMFMSITDLFNDYLKNFDIGEKYQLIIVSKDIVADDHKRSSYGTTYESRYKNVDFSMALLPDAKSLEVLYGGRKYEFAESYLEYLTKRTPMIDLCAIVDLVVNEKKNVILFCTDTEYTMNYFEIMREAIMNSFQLYMISYQEFKADNSLLYNYGDDDKIRELLNFQIDRLQLIDENVNMYLNKYTETMIEKLTELLENKSIEELQTFARERNIHINKRKPKDVIISDILYKIKDKS